MSDFFQPGTITTLHRLTEGGVERLESELERFGDANPVGLVLPALYREFESEAMRGIVEELRQVRYLRRIVCAIGNATKEQYAHARTFFDEFRVPVTALWLEDPRVVELMDLFAKNDLSPGGPGKGRACWMAFGCLFAEEDIDVVALHDCDIRNYSREIVARLVYPLAHPNLGYEFNKGFYARVSETLHGRVTRLFFTPLVRAVQGMTPEIPYLRFLDSFRYALAGEFAMQADLARAIRIPNHWGLEVGVLAEVYRNVSPLRISQVDLADNYEHKHQDLSPGDPEKGLRRMARDIAMSLFRSIAQEGFVLTQDHFRSLLIYYIRFAQDTIRRYYADAVINGLKFDRHAEDVAVHAFAESLRDASAMYLEDPLGAPQIPNWNRVASAIPDVYDRLRSITADMQIAPGTKSTEEQPDSSQLAPAQA
jgi:glucosyl-3-phosphoglycerate synthase